jgi:hypothetical protein
MFTAENEGRAVVHMVAIINKIEVFKGILNWLNRI